jgi:hypothetical protein
MNEQVLRYTLPTNDGPLEDMTVALPVGADFLHFDYQRAREEFSVWVLADPNAPPSPLPRRFVLVGTGHDLPVDREFLAHRGSVIVDGFHIFHLFERFSA